MRLYAHCVSERSHYIPGSLVVYGMNLKSRDVQLQLPSSWRVTIDAYVLSPANNNITSSQIQLNGKTLSMPGESSLPDLQPRRLNMGEMPLIPSLQYGYFVIQGMNTTACLKPYNH